MKTNFNLIELKDIVTFKSHGRVEEVSRGWKFYRYVQIDPNGVVKHDVVTALLPGTPCCINPFFKDDETGEFEVDRWSIGPGVTMGDETFREIKEEILNYRHTLELIDLDKLEEPTKGETPKVEGLFEQIVITRADIIERETGIKISEEVLTHSLMMINKLTQAVKRGLFIYDLPEVVEAIGHENLVTRINAMLDIFQELKKTTSRDKWDEMVNHIGKLFGTLGRISRLSDVDREEEKDVLDHDDFNKIHNRVVEIFES